MTYTLNMFNTGQITLPKKWRSKYNTTKFIAEEKDGNLVISPIISNNDGTIYYESEDGSFGLYNEEGIDTDYLLQELRRMQNG